jgi:tryptophan-rich sensory protein
VANIFRKPRAGAGRLGLYLLIFVGSALALNAWIFSGPAIMWSRSLENPPWAPSGAVIGAVWMGQFTLLSISAFLIDRLGDPTRKDPARLAVVAWWLVCMAWPAVYFGFQSIVGGVALTIAALVLGVPALALAWRTARPSALVLLPLQAWLIFALVLIVTVWRMNP